MKIVAYSALAYGSVYLPYSIASVMNYIDEYIVLYSPHGSHGSRAHLPKTESESEASLKQLAQYAAGHKLRWYTGDWYHEGDQRDTIYSLAKDADVILVLDYDEIWSNPRGIIDAAIKHGGAKQRVQMIHFWRSFKRAILNDPAYPVRVLLPKSDLYLENTIREGRINHMGYAIPTWLVEYKQHIHGHKGEWRKDWFESKWKTNAQTDTHPTNLDYWNPVTVDPKDYLPNFMKMHPYWFKDVID